MASRCWRRWRSCSIRSSRSACALAARLHPYNLIVSNVPGPQFPLYMLGARMLEGYPVVPLFEYQGLGIATFSYDGMLFWAVNACWDLVPDLHVFVEGLEESFRELQYATPTTTAGRRQQALAGPADECRRGALTARCPPNTIAPHASQSPGSPSPSSAPASPASAPRSS